MANLPDQPDPTPGPGQLRVSDADREQVADQLRQAAGEGRLTMDELDERLGSAYAARTFADLEPLTHDLPTAAGPARAPAMPSRVGGHATSVCAVSVMGGFSRKGSWVVPRTFTAVTVLGGGTTDLRNAMFAEQQVTIWAVSLMGGIEVVVPPDIEVVVHGVPIMGGIHGPVGSNPAPGAPRVIVNAVAVMGGIDVKVKAPKPPKPPKGQLGRRK
ncbi:MAG: DUF1707 domain-containing protein [Actinomycetota bacterium]